MIHPLNISLQSVAHCLLTGLVTFFLPGMAWAHISEQSFVLLLPTRAYILGGCLSVVVSILVVSFAPGRFIEALFRPARLPSRPLPVWLQIAPSLVATLLFAGIVLLGIFGPRDPLTNMLPLVIWTGGWVILVSFTGVIGNVWPALNPWTGLHRLIFGAHHATGPLKLPEWVGAWPALVQFMVFFSFSVVDPAPDDPDRLAMIVASYWLFNFIGMSLFGARVWMDRCEGFSVFFGLLSLVAVFRRGPSVGVPGWGIVDKGPLALSLSVFAVASLGAGSFDGLKETFWWMARIGVNPLEFPGRTAVIWSSQIGLMVSTVLLVALFGVVTWAGWMLAHAGAGTKNRVSFGAMFCTYAPAVLPIAVAFHISHFLVSFLINGQYLLAVMGDPFATGANFFGLGQIRVTTGFLNTPGSVKSIWLTQAGVVVFGHILAVLVSHRGALRLFDNRRQAALSQIPLGAFMVLYTLFGLWLLSTARGV